MKEIREKESSIGIEVSPIIDMYNMLEHYNADYSATNNTGSISFIEKEEIEKKSSIFVTWRRVVEHADAVSNNLSAVQGKYRNELIKDIREFGIDIRNLRKVFEDSGPLVSGIKPTVG